MTKRATKAQIKKEKNLAKLNKHPYIQLEKIRKEIEEHYPKLISGFYLINLHTSSMATSAAARSAVFELHGQELVWRSYRRSDTPDKNTWDVDQTNSINNPMKKIPSKKQIPGHHINHSIEEDIMKRNQIVFEVIEDKNGNFKLNKNNKDLVNCFINFEEMPNRS